MAAKRAMREWPYTTPVTRMWHIALLPSRKYVGTDTKGGPGDVERSAVWQIALSARADWWWLMALSRISGTSLWPGGSAGAASAASSARYHRG